MQKPYNIYFFKFNNYSPPVDGQIRLLFFVCLFVVLFFGRTKRTHPFFSVNN